MSKTVRKNAGFRNKKELAAAIMKEDKKYYIEKDSEECELFWNEDAHIPFWFRYVGSDSSFSMGSSWTEFKEVYTYEEVKITYRNLYFSECMVESHLGHSTSDKNWCSEQAEKRDEYICTLVFEDDVLVGRVFLDRRPSVFMGVDGVVTVC